MVSVSALVRVRVREYLIYSSSSSDRPVTFSQHAEPIRNNMDYLHLTLRTTRLLRLLSTLYGMLLSFPLSRSHLVMIFIPPSLLCDDASPWPAQRLQTLFSRPEGGDVARAY